MSLTCYPITPMGKPRLTRGTRFSDRAKRYYAWRDQARLLNIQVPPVGSLVVFVVPMPRSWSKKKKRAKQWTLHDQVPDCDNMMKALLDACYADDAKVALFAVGKVWGYEGEIRVEPGALSLKAVMTRMGIY